MLGRTAIGLLFGLVVALPATAQDQQKAQAAFERSDYAVALKEWRPLAKRGNASSQFNLGLMYENGLGVPQDHVQAVTWYRKAAEQGHADAANNLGSLYDKGLGVKQNRAQAAVWYRKAAKGQLAAPNALSTASRGDFQVQLGAVKSQVRALKEARRLTRIHKSALGNLKIRPVRADLGKRGIVYRLRTVPLSDRASAGALCREISLRNQGCIVIKP